MKVEVEFTKLAEKSLNKLPVEIINSLMLWIKYLQAIGLVETRKISGYHDEPLKGDRKGQRSIRLNRSYRAIYIVSKSGDLEIVKIMEVNKHKY